MSLVINIQGLNNNAAMPNGVGGGVGIAIDDAKAPKVESLQVNAAAQTDISVVANFFRASDGALIAAVGATVANGAWAANVPGNLPNDSYVVQAVASATGQTPASDSRGGIHKP